jgi:hypothetical protein
MCFFSLLYASDFTLSDSSLNTLVPSCSFAFHTSCAISATGFSLPSSLTAASSISPSSGSPVQDIRMRYKTRVHDIIHYSSNQTVRDTASTRCHKRQSPDALLGSTTPGLIPNFQHAPGHKTLIYSATTHSKSNELSNVQNQRLTNYIGLPEKLLTSFLDKLLRVLLGFQFILHSSK